MFRLRRRTAISLKDEAQKDDWLSKSLKSFEWRSGARAWRHKNTVLSLTPWIPQQGNRQRADGMPWVLLQSGFRTPSLLPSPHPICSHVAQAITCGSQDWLTTWGRHGVMTRGPVGVWLSRHRPLTMCWSAAPFGFHFYTVETHRKQKKIIHSFTLLVGFMFFFFICRAAGIVNFSRGIKVYEQQA